MVDLPFTMLSNLAVDDDGAFVFGFVFVGEVDVEDVGEETDHVVRADLEELREF